MGTCIAVVKIVGASSLGLLTSSLTYQSLQAIPELISRLNNQVLIAATSAADVLDAFFLNLVLSNAAHVALASLSTALFSMAYKYSPSSGKHPYLMYSALGAPLALLAWSYQGLPAEYAVVKRSNARKAQLAQKPPVVKTAAPVAEEEEPLGKSYVHVSDDSLAVSTPAASAPGTPLHKPVADISIEQEVEDAISKKAFLRDLETVKQSYFVASAVSGVGLAVCAVGLIGDFFII